jgi:hypothetical protein
VAVCLLRPKCNQVEILSDRAGIFGRFAQGDSVCGVPEMKEGDSLGGELKLTQVGDFFVEVGEGGFEGFAMVGVSSGREVVHDSDTR